MPTRTTQWRCRRYRSCALRAVCKSYLVERRQTQTSPCLPRQIYSRRHCTSGARNSRGRPSYLQAATRAQGDAHGLACAAMEWHVMEVNTSAIRTLQLTRARPGFKMRCTKPPAQPGTNPQSKTPPAAASSALLLLFLYKRTVLSKDPTACPGIH
jgi:hypothetical protein